MTIEIHDAINGDGLMDVQGKAFACLEALFTAVGTTVPDTVETFIAQFLTRADASDLDVAETMENLPAAVRSWQSQSSTISSQVRTNLQNLLMELVAADASQSENSLTFALQYLINQMIDDGDYVAGNTIGFTLTPDAGNSGDVEICYSSLRGDGQENQNILAETIAVSVVEPAGPILRFRAPIAQANKLAHDWPKGSGINLTITATDAAASLLSNGDFEDTTIDDIPDGWIGHIATPGTTLKVTDLEVQTILITGTPTGGSYLLQWTDSGGNTRSTPTLAYDASGSDVQAALRQIPELSAVTVSTIGTSPNFLHSVTFYNAIGNPGQMTSVNDMTGGSSPTITHGTPTVGSNGAYRGRAMEFDSNGSEVTAVYHPLTIDTETVYFVHLRVIRIGAAVSGEVRVEIVDGIGGSVTVDNEGNANSLTIDVSAMGTANHDSEWFSFRVPDGTSMPVYLRIRISTAIPNTASVYFDNVAVVAGTRLYAGGPFVAVFSGTTISGPDNTWDLVVANNRAGEIQEWYNRIFDMAAKDLLLPVSGSTLIPPSWT